MDAREYGSEPRMKRDIVHGLANLEPGIRNVLRNR
jgi:hypothetical protein